MDLHERIKRFGYARERVAVALLGLSYFCVLYALIALSPPAELAAWRAVFAGLAVCYITAFVALASGWFWARWFASGLGWSGLMMAVAGLLMVGWQVGLAIYGGLHGSVVLFLMGPRMAEQYELQPGWRERFKMDEYGVARVRRYVTRGAAALPGLIFWVLAPRDGQGAAALAAVAVALLAVAGLGGGLLLRTWGVLGLAAAAAALPVVAAVLPEPAHLSSGWGQIAGHAGGPIGAAIAALLLAAAVVPFAGPAIRYFRALPHA